MLCRLMALKILQAFNIPSLASRPFIPATEPPDPRRVSEGVSEGFLKGPRPNLAHRHARFSRTSKGRLGKRGHHKEVFSLEESLESLKSPKFSTISRKWSDPSFSTHSLEAPNCLEALEDGHF